MTEALRPIVALSVVAWFAFGLVARPGQERRLALGAVGVLWMVAGIVAVDFLAARAGWWEYVGDAPRFGVTPVDLLLAWAVAWGGLPLVATRRVRPLPAVAVFLAVDLAVVPHLTEIVALGPGWLFGEAVLLGAVALPGLCLLRWMQERRRLAVRAAMLVGLFTVVILGGVPLAAAQISGVAVDPPWGGRALFAWAQVLALPGLVGVAGVIELARRGGGTPYPWDPPDRVVSTGPYAYVANPLQLSIVLALPLYAAMLWHWPTLIGGAVATAFSLGIAAPHEEAQLAARWGEQWEAYRVAHRSWLPTWRPVFTGEPAATLYVDMDCGPCRQVGEFYLGRDPVGLTIAAAAAYPGPPLWRVTYGRGSHEVAGTRALATALEHLHFGWAMLGWLLRLPGVAWLAQVIGDATGNGPHLAGRGTCEVGRVAS